MRNRLTSKFKFSANALIAAFAFVLVSSLNISPAMAFAGTLENGNLAYAQSSFATGEACNYLPGFETGFDAWHFVLTTRGATFQQSPTNPAVSINLNFVFMRQDNTLFVIKSGAWVQTGKGAYVYTPVQDKIRMVQAGSVALINGSDSGMRLSHTCPGSGSAVTPTVSPTPVASATPTPTVTPTATKSATPTSTATNSSTTAATPTPTTSATRSATPTQSATPTATPTVTKSATPTASATATPTQSVSATPTPTPTPTLAPGVIPTLKPRPNPTASAIQIHPTGPRNPLPTPSPTQQGIAQTPTPFPTASPNRTISPTPSTTTSSVPTVSPSNSAEPTASPEPSNEPPVVPTPPKVEDPKNVVYVDPITPTVITPSELPSAPKTPIEIVVAPKFGTVEISQSNEITYTPKINDSASPRVDIVELKYTNLAGSVVVIRKEFVVTQKGDVPKIIQTGYGDSNSNKLIPLFVLWIVFILITIRVRNGRKYE